MDRAGLPLQTAGRFAVLPILHSADPALKYAGIREFALSLPEVTEQPHFELGSFRVRGRIFVTAPPDRPHLHLFLPEEAREQALAIHPDFTEELRCGRKVVGPRLALPPAPAAAVRHLVRQAWAARAPKALLASADDH